MERHEVAIIGGGIVGTATAYYLGKLGIAATLFDPSGVAAKASGVAYGGLSTVSGIGTLDPLRELGQHSLELHAALEEDLEADCKYRDRSTLNVAFAPDELSSFRERVRWINQSPSHVQAELLSAEVALKLEPRLNPTIAGGSLLHGTREVDSLELCSALATASGCDLIETRVVSLRPQGDAVILSTEDGNQHLARTVLCANGTWVEPLLASMSVHVDVPPLKGQILRLKTSGPPIEMSIGWNGNYCTTKTDGLVWAGTTEEQAGLDESTTAQGRKLIQDNLNHVLPGLDTLRVIRQTACLRPTTQDGLPILDRVASCPNVIVATGTGRKGILYGPAMGEVAADLIVGNQPSISTSSFSLERFVH